MRLGKAFNALNWRMAQMEADVYLDELVQLVKDACDHHDTRSLNGSVAGLAIGTAKVKVLIANTVTALVAGTRVAKTTAEVAFTATGHDIAKSKQARFLYSMDNAGTVTVTKGSDYALADVAPYPAQPASSYLLGHVLIATGAGAIFDATTTELDDVAITVTYTDCLGWLAADLALAESIDIPSDVAL